jgi:hypothetical protein
MVRAQLVFNAVLLVRMRLDQADIDSKRTNVEVDDQGYSGQRAIALMAVALPAINEVIDLRAPRYREKTSARSDHGGAFSGRRQSALA